MRKIFRTGNVIILKSHFSRFLQAPHVPQAGKFVIKQGNIYKKIVTKRAVKNWIWEKFIVVYNILKI